MQNLAKKSKTSNNINYLMNNSNNKINDPKDIANFMNNHYCKVGETLSKNIKKPPDKNLKLPTENPKTIFVTPSNYKEIEKIIKYMGCKNGGIDMINTKTLQTISNNISDVLAHIFNLCVEKSVWPEALKAAEIVPIYKNGSKYDVNNYRPI